MPPNLYLGLAAQQVIEAPSLKPAILDSLFHPDATYEDRIGVNDIYTDHGDESFDFRDVVYGRRCFDYVSTSGGEDKITVGDNDGTWRGSGNEFGNATITGASWTGSSMRSPWRSGRRRADAPTAGPPICLMLRRTTHDQDQWDQGPGRGLSVLYMWRSRPAHQVSYSRRHSRFVLSMRGA